MGWGNGRRVVIESHQGLFDSTGWPKTFETLWRLHATLGSGDLRLTHRVSAHLTLLPSGANEALLARLDALSPQELAQQRAWGEGWQVGENYEGDLTGMDMTSTAAAALRYQYALVEQRYRYGPLVEGAIAQAHALLQQEHKQVFAELRTQRLRQFSPTPAGMAYNDHTTSAREAGIQRLRWGEQVSPDYSGGRAWADWLRMMATDYLQQREGHAPAPWSAALACTSFRAETAEWFRPFVYAITLSCESVPFLRFYPDGCLGLCMAYKVNERSSAYTALEYALRSSAVGTLIDDSGAWRLSLAPASSLLDYIRDSYTADARGFTLADDASPALVPSLAHPFSGSASGEEYLSMFARLDASAMCSGTQYVGSLRNSPVARDQMREASDYYTKGRLVAPLLWRGQSDDYAQPIVDAPPAPPDFSPARAALHAAHRPVGRQLCHEVPLLPLGRPDTGLALAQLIPPYLLAGLLYQPEGTLTSDHLAYMDEAIAYQMAIEQWYASVRADPPLARLARKVEAERRAQRDAEIEQARAARQMERIVTQAQRPTTGSTRAPATGPARETWRQEA